VLTGRRLQSSRCTESDRRESYEGWQALGPREILEGSQRATDPRHGLVPRPLFPTRIGNVNAMNGATRAEIISAVENFFIGIFRHGKKAPGDAMIIQSARPIFHMSTQIARGRVSISWKHVDGQFCPSVSSGNWERPAFGEPPRRPASRRCRRKRPCQGQRCRAPSGDSGPFSGPRGGSG
jgi:hypothetical protein